MLVIVLNLSLLVRIHPIIIVALLKDLYLLLDIVSLLLVLAALLLCSSRSYLGVLSVPLLAHHFLQRQLLVVRGMLGIWCYLELLVTLLAVDRCIPIHESLLWYD